MFGYRLASSQSKPLSFFRSRHARDNFVDIVRLLVTSFLEDILAGGVCWRG